MLLLLLLLLVHCARAHGPRTPAHRPKYTPQGETVATPHPDTRRTDIHQDTRGDERGLGEGRTAPANISLPLSIPAVGRSPDLPYPS